MLTLEDRSKFEALIADYAKREIEFRQATERRHAAMHAILDYTNNKLSMATRGAIEHGVALQRSKQDARKIVMHSALGKIAEGTRDVRSTISPTEIFEIACEALKGAPGYEVPPRPPGAQDFSGPQNDRPMFSLDTDWSKVKPGPAGDLLKVNVPERRVGMRPELAAGFGPYATIEGVNDASGEPVKFPFPDFNTTPTERGHVTIEPATEHVARNTDLPTANEITRESLDASRGFLDTFTDLEGMDRPADTFGT